MKSAHTHKRHRSKRRNKTNIYIASKRKAQACTNGRAVDRRDNGHRKAAHGKESLVKSPHEDAVPRWGIGGAISQKVKVATGAKGSARSRQHHRTNPFAVVSVLDLPTELPDHLGKSIAHIGIQCVQPVGIVQSDDSNPFLGDTLDQDRV
jgi:hypothetical protein